MTERERERERKNPRISIIIPVYNVAHLVSFGLDSLLNQTILHKDPASLEVIAVDDCSTDNSLEVLRRYEQTHPQLFHVIHSPRNRKQGGARNLGLSVARGEWIGFMDADDWLAPDFCEKMLAKADATGADMVGCWAAITDNHSFNITQILQINSPEYTWKMGEPQYKHLILGPSAVWSKIYKAKNLFSSNANKAQYNIFAEDIFCEDVPTIITISCKSQHYELIPEPLYYYYENHSSSTRTKLTKQKAHDRMTASRLLLENAKKSGLYQGCKDEIDLRLIDVGYIPTLTGILANPNLEQKTSLLKQLKLYIQKYLPDFRKNPYYTSRFSREQRIYARLHCISIPLLLICYKPVQLPCRIRRLCILLVRDPALAFAKIRNKIYNIFR